MSEQDTSGSAQNPSSKTSNRKLVLVGLVMALGLFALIALNMK